MEPPVSLTLRLAVPEDLPALRDLMNASIGELLKPFLKADEVAASFDIMGLDSQLIADGTYFVVEDFSVEEGGRWPAAAVGVGGPPCSAATTRPGATPPCWIRPATRPGCGRCTPTPIMSAKASAGRSWRPARPRRRGRGSRAASWPEPWPASRCTAPAAITRSSGSPPTSSGVEVPLVRMGKALRPANPQ
jgi:hypothetical protein